ncbi:unnamed protein product [Candidula unifasciata]|uniref:Uncharacterized protein n=1 Tax=Candidula unifasciata TaxID=100452 RepID=A0A8S3YVR4_9EUPU|nr:unnamed protein product [Candidula unifasciata]
MDTRLLGTSPPPFYNNTGCTPGGHQDTMDSVTSNGGFIAMAAGLSIVIPIVSVLVVQLRRAKMAERARLRATPVASDAEADDPRIIDLPPPYEQMFGSNFNSFNTVVHPVHSRNFEILVDEIESVQQQRNVHTADRRENELANVFRELQPPGITDIGDDTCGGQACARNVTQHPGNSDSLIATISGPYTTETVISNHVSYTSDIGSQSTNTNIPNTLPPPIYTDFPTVTEQESTHHVHLFPATSDQERTDNNEHTYVEVGTLVAPWRHPGMHISFEDFSAGGNQDNQADFPPPSYEEALDILEKIELAKDHVY